MAAQHRVLSRGGLGVGKDVLMWVKNQVGWGHSQGLPGSKAAPLAPSALDAEMGVGAGTAGNGRHGRGQEEALWDAGARALKVGCLGDSGLLHIVGHLERDGL
jgi:hypothetical protein